MTWYTPSHPNLARSVPEPFPPKLKHGKEGFSQSASQFPLHLLVSIFLRVEAHVPRHQTPLPPALQTTLGIHDAVAPLRRLHELGVLLLEDLEVALGFPVPDGVGGEDEVHFLEGALVGFRVESPDDDDGGGVDGAEEVEGLFVEGGEDGGEEEDLDLVFALVFECLRGKVGFDVPSTRCQWTSRPHPMRCLGHGLPVGRSRPGTAMARSTMSRRR